MVYEMSGKSFLVLSDFNGDLGEEIRRVSAEFDPTKEHYIGANRTHKYFMRGDDIHEVEKRQPSNRNPKVA